MLYCASGDGSIEERSKLEAKEEPDDEEESGREPGPEYAA
jgi:hypothetical protein